MTTELILDETNREETVNSIREIIRNAVNKKVTTALEEKYSTIEEEETPDEETEEEETPDEDITEEEGDEGSEEEDEEEEITESISVSATKIGGRGTDELIVKRISDLKRLAKSRQYEYLVVTKKNGEEKDYTIDPQGNLVEM